MSDADGTGEGLFDFLHWAAERGEMVDATAKGRLGAARAVLTAVSDDPKTVDLRALDMESTLNRFETLSRTKYKSGSMATYKRRFEQAVAQYLAWLDGDAGWKTAGASARTESDGVKAARPKRAKRLPPTSDPQASVPTPGPVESAQMIPHDFPLRPGLLVRLTLPMDLNSADAARISAFVDSLAFDGPVSSDADET